MRYTWILAALIVGLTAVACGAESPGAPESTATPTWQQWLGQQITEGRCPSPDHTMTYSNENRTPPYRADFTCVAPTPTPDIDEAVDATIEALSSELTEGITELRSAGVPEKLIVELMSGEYDHPEKLLDRMAEEGVPPSIIRRVESMILVEPSGGASLPSSSRVNCDEIFRNQLVRQTKAYNAARMNQVRVQVQQHQEDCHADAWDPVILEDVRHGGGSHGECIDWRTETIGGLSVPTGLEYFTLGKSPKTGRDGRNNIIVYFSEHYHERPGDGAACWMYIERLGTWASGG